MTRPTTFATHAPELAAAGWEVGPLNAKVPAIPSAHPEGDPIRGECKGECGRWGHGCLDFTTDLAVIGEWAQRYPTANIGARPPRSVIVIDTDPRHGGEANLLEVAEPHGGMPETLTCFSGRNDGGRHRYYRHPGGTLTGARLPAGVDLKTHAGYVVVPPSIHPATGKPYRWSDPTASIVDCPAWLVPVLRKLVPPPRPAPWRPRVVNDADSVADWFTAATTWEQILTGWTQVHGGWRHPTATSTISATVRHDLLFVYSPNTPFEQTEPESPHGYTRFRAWAVLEHHGNLSEAAKAARDLRDRQAISA